MTLKQWLGEWFASKSSRKGAVRRRGRVSLQVETLEARDVPAVLPVSASASLDGANFFTSLTPTIDVNSAPITIHLRGIAFGDDIDAGEEVPETMGFQVTRIPTFQGSLSNFGTFVVTQHNDTAAGDDVFTADVTYTPLRTSTSPVHDTFTFSIASTTNLPSSTTPSNSVSIAITVNPVAAGLATFSGNNQKTVVQRQYSNPLIVQLVSADNVTPVRLAGVNVTFKVPTFVPPTFGPSATLTGGLTSVVVPTDINGRAASPLLTANQYIGLFTVAATTTNPSRITNFTLTNTSGALRFISAPSTIFGGDPFSVTLQLFDDTTNQPLRVAGRTVVLNINGTVLRKQTDANGMVTFSNLVLKVPTIYTLTAQLTDPLGNPINTPIATPTTKITVKNRYRFGL